MQVYDTHSGARARRARHIGSRLVASASVAALASIGIAGTAQADPNDDITDPVLRACVEDALGINSGDVIPEAEVAALTTLTCNGTAGNRISVLDGLEHFTSLQTLDLSTNDIENIDALANLTELVNLRLHFNNIIDISPLAALDSVQELGLNANEIADVLPLAGLTGLTELYLAGNGITDIGALETLVDLEVLFLHGANDIEDIEPLAGMEQLQRLLLNGNSISDISVLSGKLDLWQLDVSNNHIADVSVLDVLNVTTLGMADQTLDLGSLPVGSFEPNPVVGPDGFPVPLNDLYNYGANAFSPDAEGAGSVTWDNSDGFNGTLSFTGTEAVEFIDIPDPALLQCINDELSQGPADPVTPAQAAGINSLYCNDMGIEDLGGIEHFPNLGILNASGNLISDLSPLTALGSISTGVNLSDNRIVDVTPLSTMFFGEQVNLSGNQIFNLSPLAGMAGSAFVDATDQVVDLGILAIDQAQPNPVLGYSGLPLGLSAFYDAATNTFTPSAPGAGQTAWSHAPTDAEPWAFSGTLLFDVAAEDEVAPVDPDDPAPAEPAPDQPAPVDPAPAEPEGLAASGAPSVLAPLSGAAMLLLLGLGLVSSRRVRGLTN